MSREDSHASRPASLSRDKTQSLAVVHAAFERLAGESLPRDTDLERLAGVRRLGEGELLFAAGSVDRCIHVVLDGFLVLKYESRQGTSWVKGFVPPHIPFACVSCLDDVPAPFSASAGVPTDIVCIPFRAIDRVAGQSMGWQRAVGNAFKLYGQRKEKREMELLMLSAEDRYIRFLQEMPAIASQLKQHEIASYVRVTPVSLSRIRRRLHLTSGGQTESIGRPRC